MKYLQSFVDWIVSLESGTQFRNWASILIKILGVIALIALIVGGITVSFGAIKIAKYWPTGSRVLMIIGSIISFAVNLVFGIVVAMLCWRRANKVRALGNESHFTLIPIMTIMVRLFGEFVFFAFIGSGVQLLVASLFGSQIGGFWQHLGIGLRGGSFAAGAISFVTSVLVGAILLFIIYFIAEQIHLLVDMATNLKKLTYSLAIENDSKQTLSDVKSSSTNTTSVKTARFKLSNADPEYIVCQNCGQDNFNTYKYCQKCGALFVA
ncbi:hypothetical protein ACX8XN_18695 [Calditrichota bacterium GD2]